MVASATRNARRIQRKLLRVARNNICGPCDACCEVVGVAALDKPINTRCEHQNGKGCAIYAKRPSECAVYRCEWLMGGWPLELRPDKLGVILNGQKKPLEGCGIVAYQTRPGGFKDAEKVLSNIARKAGPVLLVGELGPDGSTTCAKMEATG